MGEVEATRPAGCAVWMTSAVAACALVAGCQPSELELPPVRTPLGVHLACQPPQPSPSAFLRPAPVPGSSCGLGDPECDEVRTLVVQVDEHGRVTGAYLRGRRSPELDGCILGEVRANGWEFGPARECNGDPIAGEYVAELGIVCGSDAAKVASGRTSGCS